MAFYCKTTLSCCSIFTIATFQNLFIHAWPFEVISTSQNWLERQIEWNSTSENWLEFYKRYCGRVCKNGSVADVSPFNCEQPNCFECDCDPTCSIYGTCCPQFNSTIDLDVNNLGSLEATEKSQTKKLPSQERFYCSNFPGSDKYYYVISDCSPEYLHNLEQEELNTNSKYIESINDIENGVSVSKRCVESNMDTFDDVTPYIDIQYGITFKNKFCAICNGYRIKNNNSRFVHESAHLQGDGHSTIVDETTGPLEGIVAAWTLNVSCYHYQQLFHITSEFKLFKSALELGRDECLIVYTQPNITALAKTCDPEFHADTETTCSSSDSRLQDHCLQLKHKFLRVHGGQTIFCYICNGRQLSANSCHWGVRMSSQCAAWCAMIARLTTQHSQSRVLGFDGGQYGAGVHGGVWYVRGMDNTKTNTRTHLSLLLGVSRSEDYPTSGVHTQCNISSKWRTNEGECQPASCSAGKLAEEDGLCSTGIKQIRGLGYKLFMVLIPDSVEVCVSNVDVIILGQKIYMGLSEISKEINITVKIRVLSRSCDSRNEEFLRNVIVTAHIISDLQYSRDEFENRVLRLTREAWEVKVSGGDNTTINLTALVLGDDFAPYFDDKENQTVKECLQSHDSTDILQGHDCMLRDTISTNSTYIGQTSSTVEKMYIIHCSNTNTNFEQWLHKDKFIDITSSLTCPFVAINVTDISVSESSVFVHFSYNNIKFTVSSTSITNISLVSGEIRICFDFFNSLTNVPYFMPDSYVILVTNYLEIICTCLSVVCLLISFVTYCLFPVLRTLPGLNNMCLIICLAFAQTFLFITVEFGIAGQLSQDYCLFHAISLHYFWLATFMWMSACCIHMYRVFTCQSTKFINANCDIRRHLQYCLFAFGLPVVIIVIYVVICLWLTSGSSNGYSNQYCFLDVTMSVLTTLLSLVAPLCLTILTNGVLFVQTIREIVHVSRLRSSAVDGKGVITYVKLSTLTGVSYIVCGAALHLHSPILNLLASPIMCLQGVFIFMSFICNKRVGNLYCELIRRRHNHPQSDSRSQRMHYIYTSPNRHTSKSATESTSF